jgi:sulfur carrier protein ThiS
MALHIFLSSSLRNHVVGYDPQRGLTLTISETTTVAEVCERIGIPEADVKIVMIDGKGQSLDFKLTGEERVALFPPVGGG